MKKLLAQTDDLKIEQTVEASAAELDEISSTFDCIIKSYM